MTDATTRPDDDEPQRRDTEDISDDDMDVEGHSLLQAELHRTIATSRSREAADWARSEQARKQQKGR